jgi:hypothetical protein
MISAKTKVDLHYSTYQQLSCTLCTAKQRGLMAKTDSPSITYSDEVSS